MFVLLALFKEFKENLKVLFFYKYQESTFGAFGLANLSFILREYTILELVY